MRSSSGGGSPRHGTPGIEYPGYPGTPEHSAPSHPAPSYPAEHEGPVPRVPRDEVRRRLLTAAARSFAELGYADSRLEDIANAAGFTKGAVYSNFAGKRELFGAILGDGADSEFAAVMKELGDTDQPAEAVGLAARTVARRIVGDAERGQLGLEFAARAARDERTRAILTPLRRAQRSTAARSIASVAERTGVRPAVRPELAALILHCLCNGLSNECIADPEAIGADTVEEALAAVLTALIDPQTSQSPHDPQTPHDPHTPHSPRAPHSAPASPTDDSEHSNG
ncbi:TetR/AcrR family transcriptional regulator [Streptomyces sp. JV176]|uniref:TetR/AcrR family transcriptional regulator n=1 Tax=Streptomyces sp. JV176 TaxID=858630 RepID=UPI002E7894FF|nr:TetR/AcrR family transcriptional regulator [Streptomyces sp. JV176]MEE1803254.1 TetR/AcrR family transcriptional regulator [Streptomyces sp. JV176]